MTPLHALGLAFALAACGDADAPPTDVPPADGPSEASATVEVMDPEFLLARFPEAVGPHPLARSSTNVDGALGYQVSRATARYTVNIDRLGPNVILNVLDVGTADMAENMGYGWGTGADTTGVTEFEGFPARIVSDPRQRKEEVRVLVARRFLVESLGEGVDADLVREAARSLDLPGLAAMAEGS